MGKKQKLTIKETPTDEESVQEVEVTQKKKGTATKKTTKKNEKKKKETKVAAPPKTKATKAALAAKREAMWKRVKVPSSFLSGLQEAGFYGLEELNPEDAGIKVLDPSNYSDKRRKEDEDEFDDEASDEKKGKMKKKDLLDDFRGGEDEFQDTDELAKILNIESDSDDDEASADRLRHYKVEKGGRKLKSIETEEETRARKIQGQKRRQRKHRTFTYDEEAEAKLTSEAEAVTDEWSAFRLNPRVLLGVRKLGFPHPTPVQRVAIPAAVTAGKDIIGAAETGSGKTLAYAIPLVNGIVERKKAIAMKKFALEQKFKEEEKAEMEGGGQEPQKKKFKGLLKEGKKKPKAARKGNDCDDTDIPEEMLREANEMFEEAEEVEGDESESEGEDEVEFTDESKRAALERLEENFMYGLILTPTRELAIQVRDHIKAFAESAGVTVAAIVGGLSAQKQERVLSECPDIVVATTGRLWELISEQGVHYLGDLTHLMYLVVDEADRMVESGHYKELDEITKIMRSTCVEKTQTFIFSATLAVSQAKLAALAAARSRRKDGNRRNKPAEKITEDGLIVSTKKDEKPTPLDRVLDTIEFKRVIEIVDLTRERVTVQGLREYKFNCTDEEKDTYLYYFLKTRKPGRTIVFANAISMVRRLVTLLRRLKICSVRLHGGIQQRQRLAAIDHFRAHESCVMVASDVASRGLDIPDVAYVIHYNLPKTAELYVHRCGRTARAGQEGLSLALVGPTEVKQLAQIDSELGKPEQPNFPLFGKKTSGSSDVDVTMANSNVDLRKLRMILATAKELNRQIHIASTDVARRRWLLNVADQLGIDRPKDLSEDEGDEDDEIRGEFDDEYDEEERAIFEDDELRRKKNMASAAGGNTRVNDEDEDEDRAGRKAREMAEWKQKLATLKERLAVMLADVGATSQAFGQGASSGGGLGARPVAVSGGMSTAMLDQAIAEARERRKELNLIHKKNAKAFKNGRMETITAAEAFRSDNFNFGTPSASSSKRKNAKKYRRKKSRK